MTDKQRLRIVTVQHPKIAKILTEIHGDNGGCTATEWEKCLKDFNNAELHLLAAGDETEQELLLLKMEAKARQLGYPERQAARLIESFHKWLNDAFD